MNRIIKSLKAKLCGLIILLVFSASGAVAQNFNYSLLASYSKLGYVYDNNFHLSRVC